ncbi:hypothetical protein U1Q18_035992, partial [Sarracenia purpurea var. burkii]
ITVRRRRTQGDRRRFQKRKNTTKETRKNPSPVVDRRHHLWRNLSPFSPSKLCESSVGDDGEKHPELQAISEEKKEAKESRYSAEILIQEEIGFLSNPETKATYKQGKSRRRFWKSRQSCRQRGKVVEALEKSVREGAALFRIFGATVRFLIGDCSDKRQRARSLSAVSGEEEAAASRYFFLEVVGIFLFVCMEKTSSRNHEVICLDPAKTRESESSWNLNLRVIIRCGKLTRGFVTS